MSLSSRSPTSLAVRLLSEKKHVIRCPNDIARVLRMLRPLLRILAVPIGLLVAKFRPTRIGNSYGLLWDVCVRTFDSLWTLAATAARYKTNSWLPFLEAKYCLRPCLSFLSFSSNWPFCFFGSFSFNGGSRVSESNIVEPKSGCETEQCL